MPRPRLVTVPPQQIYGDVPLNLPVYTMEAVERHVLRDSVQQYDSGAPLNDDPFQRELVDPNYFQGTMQMSFTNGLRGTFPEGTFSGPAFQLTPQAKKQIAQSNKKVLNARAEAARALVQTTRDPVTQAEYMKLADGFQQKAAGLADVFEDELTDPAYWNQTLDVNGLSGLGAVRPLPLPPQTVKVQNPEPVKTSTLYGVVGLSVLAIMGSVAAWAYFRKK